MDRYIIKSVNQKFQGQKIKMYYIYDTEECVTVSASSSIKADLEDLLKIWNQPIKIKKNPPNRTEQTS